MIGQFGQPINRLVSFNINKIRRLKVIQLFRANTVATLFILNIWTNLPNQMEQIQNKLFLMSVHGLRCLPFQKHFLETS